MAIAMYAGTKNSRWGTPPETIDFLKAHFGINFDVACQRENAKCDEGFFFPERDALAEEWPRDRTCFMNPPFDRALEFFRKAAEQTALGVRLVSIYKAANLETAWWQESILPTADCVLLLNKRTAFVPPAGEAASGPAYGCALIFWNIPMSSEQWAELWKRGTPIVRAARMIANSMIGEFQAHLSRLNELEMDRDAARDLVHDICEAKGVADFTETLRNLDEARKKWISNKGVTDGRTE